jgi:hypothetical protein
MAIADAARTEYLVTLVNFYCREMKKEPLETSFLKALVV